MGVAAVLSIPSVQSSGHVAAHLPQHSAVTRAQDTPPLVSVAGACVSETVDAPAYRLSDGVQPLRYVAADGSKLANPVPLTVKLTIEACTNKAVVPNALSSNRGPANFRGLEAPRASTLLMRSNARLQRHPMFGESYRESRTCACGYNQPAVGAWDVWNSNNVYGQWIFNDTYGNLYQAKTQSFVGPAGNNTVSTYRDYWHADVSYQTQLIQFWASNTSYAFDYTYCY